MTTVGRARVPPGGKVRLTRRSCATSAARVIISRERSKDMCPNNAPPRNNHPTFLSPKQVRPLHLINPKRLAMPVLSVEFPTVLLQTARVGHPACQMNLQTLARTRASKRPIKPQINLLLLGQEMMPLPIKVRWSPSRTSQGTASPQYSASTESTTKQQANPSKNKISLSIVNIASPWLSPLFRARRHPQLFWSHSRLVFSRLLRGGSRGASRSFQRCPRRAAVICQSPGECGVDENHGGAGEEAATCWEQP